MLTILIYDDFDQNVKNIHDEVDLHHTYKKKRVIRTLNSNGFQIRRACSSYRIYCSAATRTLECLRYVRKHS